MEILIGNRIKELRKERGMTQEKLAETVGISFQAVSKWENGLALPDITLVPKLAQLFGVTIDNLFAYNQKEIDEDIRQYADRALKLRATNPEEGRRILEEGLQKYPENDILLDNLLYVLNYSTNPDETIRIASKLLDRTLRIDIRYDAMRFLAYAYHAKGDTESAVAALEQIPEIYFTRLSEMAFVLSGRPKYEAAKKQKWLSFETLLQMMWKIAEYYEADGKPQKAIAETERALALISALQDEEKINDFLNYADFFKKQICRLKEI